MKNRNLLITIGAVALAAITLNLNANGVLLSPRAAGNQIKTATTAVANHNLATENQSATVSPRAQGNQATTAAGTANDVNPATACRNMTASPKAIQACAANANMPECPMAARAGCMMR